MKTNTNIENWMGTLLIVLSILFAIFVVTRWSQNTTRYAVCMQDARQYNEVAFCNKIID